MEERLDADALHRVERTRARRVRVSERRQALVAGEAGDDGAGGAGRRHERDSGGLADLLIGDLEDMQEERAASAVRVADLDPPGTNRGLSIVFL